MSRQRDPLTQAAFDRFKEITGVEPKGMRSHPGSMRNYYQVTLHQTEEVRAFCEQYYSQNANRNFRGVPIKYMGNYWKEGPMTFEIERYLFDQNLI